MTINISPEMKNLLDLYNINLAGAANIVEGFMKEFELTDLDYIASIRSILYLINKHSTDELLDK